VHLVYFLKRCKVDIMWVFIVFIDEMNDVP